MPEMKECFGRCANMSVRYRDAAKLHFLYVDEEKMKECDICPLFSRCMFLRYNEVIKDLLQILDNKGRDPRPKIG